MTNLPLLTELSQLTQQITALEQDIARAHELLKTPKRNAQYIKTIIAKPENQHFNTIAYATPPNTTSNEIDELYEILWNKHILTQEEKVRKLHNAAHAIIMAIKLPDTKQEEKPKPTAPITRPAQAEDMYNQIPHEARKIQ
jgi:hypothetical protein